MSMTHPAKWTSLDKKMNTHGKGTQQQPGDNDTSFGDNGKLSLWILPYINGTDRHVKGISILDSDKIIVSTQVSHDNSSHYGLARLNSDGALDETFEGKGFSFGKFKGNFEASGGKTLVQGQSIFMLGWTNLSLDNSVPKHLTLSRFSENGALNKDFAENGSLIIENRPTENFVIDTSNIAIQHDDKLVFSATYHTVGNHKETWGVLYRVTDEGRLDESFNQTGRLDIKFNTASEATTVDAVLIQKDGKILVAGSTKLPDGVNGFFAQFNSDGSVDKSFGGSMSGVYLLKAGDRDTFVQGLIQADNGNFLGFGKVEPTGEAVTGLLMGMTSSGRPNHQVNRGEPILTKFDPKTGDNWAAGFVDMRGRITVAGSSTELHVARFMENGTVDRNFGSGGYIKEDTSLLTAPTLLKPRKGSRFLLGGNPLGIGASLGALWAYLG